MIRWLSRGLSQPDRGTSRSPSQKVFSFWTTSSSHSVFIFLRYGYCLLLGYVHGSTFFAWHLVIQSAPISVQWIPCIVREAPVIPNFLELWLHELLGGGGDATYVLLVTRFPFPEAGHVLLAHSYLVQSRWASIINTVQSQLLYFMSEDALICGALTMVPPFRKEFVCRSLEQEHCRFLEVPTLSSFMEYATRCDYSG